MPATAAILPRTLSASLVAELCALLVGGCGAATSTAPPPATIAIAQSESPEATTDTGPPKTVPPSHGTTRFCPLDVVEVGAFKEPTPVTGERSVTVVLVNRSSARCSVKGVPKVVLKDASGERMPFRYVANSGMYVPDSDPTRITLAPDGRAYVKVGKYRCDLGVAARAETIRLASAGVDVTARLPRWNSLAMCGPGERTGSVGVSALVDSFEAAGG